MSGYYADKLSAERLRKCYEVAPLRVRQYLRAEVEHVRSRIGTSDSVLELGCGYGRVVGELADAAGMVVGIDNSCANIDMAAAELGALANCRWAVMDAVVLAFADATFDVVACIQNGISAFKVDRLNLVRECVRVTRRGGLVLFSSYAERFWPDRLEWFELQAEHGLIGEIDRNKTGGGKIICKDGFVADTVGPEEFAALCSSLGIEPVIEAVDESSLFCQINLA
jgi:2-polyprenyl-6-hydroxyphenyl methylase/3-demethylubiquinone-9 3-methyltransferase